MTIEAHLSVLWRRRRYVVDEIVVDLKLCEANAEISGADVDEETVYRRRIQEAREILSSRQNAVRFLTGSMEAETLAKACIHMAAAGRARTLWMTRIRPW